MLIGISQTVSFLIATTSDAYNFLMMSLNASGNDSQNIMACFSVPRLAVENFLKPENEMEKFKNVYKLIGGNVYNQPEIYFDDKPRPSSLDGYTPKNKKLLQYPYLYFAISAPNTTQKVFRYEDFEENKPQFRYDI